MHEKRKETAEKKYSIELMVWPFYLKRYLFELKQRNQGLPKISKLNESEQNKQRECGAENQWA